MKTIHILGNGAMGCLWASYFVTHREIAFIKPCTQKSGYSFVKKPDNIEIHSQILQPTDIQNPIDVLIIACKAFDATTAMESVRTHLTSQTIVILLQNGMGSQQAIAREFKHLPIYACSSTEGAYKTDPTTLIHAGKGINRIGAMTHLATAARLASVMSPQHYQWAEEIESIMWQKLIINCAINPLTVLFRCKNGELLENEQAVIQMKSVCNELNALIAQLKLPIPDAFELAKGVCITTSNNFSSMFQDWKNNKKTEINFITGYLVNACHEHGIDCPENLKVLEAITRLNLGEPIQLR